MMLDLLPTRADGAASNMAADFLLLQRYPAEERARFRHYGWHRPAWTFGYSQKSAWVRAAVPADEPVELCRRPTGGGLVDHRDDWTYALVVPRGHDLYAARAVESYRLVHEALAQALRELGAAVTLKTCCEPPADGADCAPAGVCFQRAELYDLVRPTDGMKIAGAAQKRGKRGLLMQGSLWRPALADVAWADLETCFTQHLATLLRATPQACGWPDYDEEHAALTEAYASLEWLEQR